MTAADSLEKLLNSTALLRESTLALAAAVMATDGSLSLLHRRFFDPRKMLEHPVPAESYGDTCFETDTGSFVGLLISRVAIQKIGLPLKEFFIYYDDTEYCLRMRRHGMLLTVPASRVVHGKPLEQVSDSVVRHPVPDWKMYYAIRNQIHTYRRHGNAGAPFCRYFLLLTAFQIKETLFARSSKLRTLWIVLCGLTDGLLARLGKNPRFLPP